MVWKCPPLNLVNWNNFWKWKDKMTTFTSEDRQICEQDLTRQVLELQDQLVKTQTELVMALAEVEALRCQLITAERSQH